MCVQTHGNINVCIQTLMSIQTLANINVCTNTC